MAISKNEKIEILNNLILEFEKVDEKELAFVMSFIGCTIKIDFFDRWISDNKDEMSKLIADTKALMEIRKVKEMIMEKIGEKVGEKFDYNSLNVDLSGSASECIKSLEERLVFNEKVPAIYKRYLLMKVLENANLDQKIFSELVMEIAKRDWFDEK